MTPIKNKSSPPTTVCCVNSGCVSHSSLRANSAFRAREQSCCLLDKGSRFIGMTKMVQKSFSGVTRQWDVQGCDKNLHFAQDSPAF